MRLSWSRASMLIIPLSALIVAGLPMLGGYPDGHDWSIELVRTAEYRNALGGGQIPPAWAENLYAGYGSPIFIYFPPLHALVASVLAALTSSIVLGSVLALLVLFLVGITGMMRAGRLIAGWDGVRAREAGAVAGILFVLHPYLIGDAFLRNANAEFSALCVAPIALAGLLDIQYDRRRGLLWLAAGIGLASIAHNAMAVVLVGGLAVMALAVYGKRRRDLATAAGGFGLGLAMSCFFWLPAIVLLRYVPATDVLTAAFGYETSFPRFDEIFAYGPFFGAGLLSIAVLVAGVVLATRKTENRLVLVLLLAGSALSLFLMLRISSPLWEGLPGLDLLEFPWRFQGPLVVLTAAIGALAYGVWAGGRPVADRRAVQLAILLIAVLNATPHLGDVDPLDRDLRDGLDDSLTAAAIRDGAISATLVDEYLPRTARAGVWLDQPVAEDGVVTIVGDAEVSGVARSGPDIRLVVEARERAVIRLGRFEYPGWTLQIDGLRVQPEANEFGSIDVSLDAGRHDVRLSYSSPPVRTVTTIVSGLAILAWGILLTARVRRGARSVDRSNRGDGHESSLESVPRRADTTT